MDNNLVLYYIVAALGGIGITFIEILRDFDNNFLKMLKINDTFLLFILNASTGSITYALIRDILPPQQQNSLKAALLVGLGFSLISRSRLTLYSSSTTFKDSESSDVSIDLDLYKIIYKKIYLNIREILYNMIYNKVKYRTILDEYRKTPQIITISEMGFKTLKKITDYTIKFLPGKDGISKRKKEEYNKQYEQIIDDNNNSSKVDKDKDSCQDLAKLFSEIVGDEIMNKLTRQLEKDKEVMKRLKRLINYPNNYNCDSQYQEFDFALVICNKKRQEYIFNRLEYEIESETRSTEQVKIRQISLESVTDNLYRFLEKKSLSIFQQKERTIALVITDIENVKSLELQLSLLKSLEQDKDKFKSIFHFPLVLFINENLAINLPKLATSFYNTYSSSIVEFTDNQVDEVIPYELLFFD